MVALETVLVSAGVSLVVSLASFEYRFRRERRVEESDEVATWYADAAQLGRSVQNTWRRKFERPNEQGRFTGYDEVKKEMNLLSNQLSRHASEGATMGMDEEVVSLLEETADACKDVNGVRITTSSHGNFRDAGETAVDQADQLENEALERI